MKFIGTLYNFMRSATILKPRNRDELKAAVDATEDAIPGVEVFFQ
jgi:hypothetical protein